MTKVKWENETLFKNTGLKINSLEGAKSFHNNRVK